MTIEKAIIERDLLLRTNKAGYSEENERLAYLNGFIDALQGATVIPKGWVLSEVYYNINEENVVSLRKLKTKQKVYGISSHKHEALRKAIEQIGEGGGDEY